MFEDSVGRILAEWIAPECDGERCVHALSTVATCTACVEVCPRSAWILDDDGLGLDTETCDGCGLCVPACPEEALSLRRDLAIRRTAAGVESAFAVCREIATSDDDGVVPCLHAIGLRDVARLHGAGIRDLIIAEAPCAGCACGEAPSLAAAIDDFAALATDRGLPAVAFQVLPPAGWRARQSEHDLPGGTPSVSRRRLFSMLSRSAGLTEAGSDAVAEKPAEKAEQLDPAPARPAGQPLPYMFVYVPEIDPIACNGCESCVRLCPHQALALKGDELARARYVIYAERCTGCGLCVDVCDENAIEVRRMDRVRVGHIDLVDRQCPACGAPYREPEARKDVKPLCRICTKVNHRKNLYQVFK